MKSTHPAIAGLNIKGPENVKSLTEIRSDVDQIDILLLDLLGLRFGYIRPAAHFKLADGKIVRDEARFQYQITRAGDLGEQRGIPRAWTEQLWAKMIELNVGIEEGEWARAKA